MGHIEINMNDEEKEIIMQALQECLSELNMEIADMEQMDYREELKYKRTVIKNFINQLKEHSIIAG